MNAIHKKRMLKLADFLEKLKPRKLNMDVVANLNGAKEMNAVECTSAACAMGWTPAVFPRHLKWEVGDRYISVVRKDGLADEEAMAKFFGIVDDYVVYYLFGTARRRYKTPKQVAAGLREFVETGKLPKRCYPDE